MASDSDITAAHNSSYHSFLGLMKWGTVAALAVTALVIILIA